MCVCLLRFTSNLAADDDDDFCSEAQGNVQSSLFPKNSKKGILEWSICTWDSCDMHPFSRNKGKGVKYNMPMSSHMHP